MKVCWKSPEQCKDQPIVGTLSASGRELKFAGFARRSYEGRHKPRLRIGDVESDESRASFALVEPGWPRRVSATVALTLLGLLGGLIWLGAKKVAHDINGEKYHFLRMIFLDPETDTYSLSKLQFFLWTTAVVFGYASA